MLVPESFAALTPFLVDGGWSGSCWSPSLSGLGEGAVLVIRKHCSSFFSFQLFQIIKCVRSLQDAGYAVAINIAVSSAVLPSITGLWWEEAELLGYLSGGDFSKQPEVVCCLVALAVNR